MYYTKKQPKKKQIFLFTIVSNLIISIDSKFIILLLTIMLFPATTKCYGGRLMHTFTITGEWHLIMIM